MKGYEWSIYIAVIVLTIHNSILNYAINKIVEKINDIEERYGRN